MMIGSLLMTCFSQKKFEKEFPESTRRFSHLWIKRFPSLIDDIHLFTGLIYITPWFRGTIVWRSRRTYEN